MTCGTWRSLSVMKAKRMVWLKAGPQVVGKGAAAGVGRREVPVGPVILTTPGQPWKREAPGEHREQVSRQAVAVRLQGRRAEVE